MNPYDAINHDTKKNSDINKSKQIKRSRNNKPSKSNQKTIDHKNSAVKPNNKKSFNDIMTDLQKTDLKQMYSTDRINVYVLLHLKALQIISGDKSRSDLEERMIKIVEPQIVNSPSKRAKFRQLLQYAVKGVELKNKMK